MAPSLHSSSTPPRFTAFSSTATTSPLQRLILARNNFSGEIPATPWPELKNLVQLDLSANLLEGSIPDQIGDLSSLSGTLNLSFNHLSGRVPKSLGKLPVTVSFDLRNNDLSGDSSNGVVFEPGTPAFLNNPNLCGFPLQNPCNGSAPSEPGSSPGLAREPGSRPKKGLSPGLIILISVADAAGVALIGLVVVYVYWKKKDKSNGSDDSEMEDGEKGGESGRGEGEGDLVAIDKGGAWEWGSCGCEEIGEGGEQRYKEFAAEVQAIGKVKHPNIVKLRAYYWAPDEKLLISDFISNGNLATALRGVNVASPLGTSDRRESKTFAMCLGNEMAVEKWPTITESFMVNQAEIAKGTARGLAYLHECSPRKFVHGDIKPSNILLDAEFQPHISDFGLNRLISITGNNPSSGGFMGGALPYLKSSQTERTNNYKAPEARVPGCRPTQKWDVYSFGVILLELLTGKSPDSSPAASTSMEVPDLVRWVRKGFEQENPLSEMVDPSLLQEVHAKKEVLAVFHVALSCTEGDPEVRPRMKSVSENLERI
ncbi:Serine/threonine-protein kinase, active site [Sesbania bispinosa]|nr:Serine/threonine-protein kinase, active site [Sesbania bispinosa]